MGKVKIRYFVCKHGRGGRGTYFYWQPSADLQREGWCTRRLADQLEKAIAEAQQFNRQVDEWRQGREVLPNQADTLPWLIKLYRLDDRFTSLSAATKRSYDQSMITIQAWSERASDPPLSTIKRKHVKLFYQAMREKTPAKANAVIRVLRLLLAFAIDEGFLDDNPASRPRMKGRPPRQQRWTEEAIHTFCSAARSADRSSLQLAVLLGAWLGQRQGDILRMTWQQYDGQQVTLRQSKTGVLIAVPVMADLKIILDEALQKRRKQVAEELEKTASKDPSIDRVDTRIAVKASAMLIAETTSKPYKVDHFRHEFRRIANAAGLKDLQFLDLRRSAVVRLAEAGCTVPQIAAITGHQLDRTLRILETYLPRNSEMARAAIHTLESYRKRTELETD
jgi:integrase